LALLFHLGMSHNLSWPSFHNSSHKNLVTAIS
jgi:hypothetical protein